MIALPGPETEQWLRQIEAALKALRLNKQFPPWKRMAAHMKLMGDTIRLEADNALPIPREWIRVRAQQDIAAEALQELADVEAKSLPEPERTELVKKRDYLSAVQSLVDLPAREITVALRHRNETRASYEVVVDRFDLASATFARYTIIVADKPGRSVSPGELALRASENFRSRLQMLATQNAALAFADLRHQGLFVEEIVRGVVGPAVLPQRGGPHELRQLPLTQVVLSACLERVSLDLQRGRVDDPLGQSFTVPAADVDFGLSWQRKWAAAKVDLPMLKKWLKSVGSRNLVYGF
ncbi:MAG: hypothetical protein HN348_04225 [Proteobacteria bacterium]|nr:hypothetical protein [Pseudomonadota bacterium]